MKDKSQMMKILELLDKEGPLSNKQISEKGEIPSGTVRCYTSILNQSGEIKHFKDIRGIFEITEKGRRTVMEERDKHE